MCGFKLVPPVSKQMPLPTKLTAGVAAPPGRYDRCAIPASRVRVALRHGEKGAGAESLQVRLAIELEAKLQAVREFLHESAIASRIERVRRQCREPARKIVARGACERDVKIGQPARCGEVDPREPRPRLGLGLERFEAKRRCLKRRHSGAQTGVGSARLAALLPEEQRLRLAVERRARQLSGGLQTLEGAGLLGHAGDDQLGLRAGSDPQMKAVAGLVHLALEQLAQHRAVRQRLPILLAGRERQKHQAAGVAGEPRCSHPGADLAHRYEQLIEGQASGHIVEPQAYPLLDREKPNPEDSAGLQRSGS